MGKVTTPRPAPRGFITSKRNWIMGSFSPALESQEGLRISVAIFQKKKKTEDFSNSCG